MLKCASPPQEGGGGIWASPNISFRQLASDPSPLTDLPSAGCTRCIQGVKWTCTASCHTCHTCRLYEVFSDRGACKVSMVLEYLDMDLYRLMRSHPQLLPANPALVKVLGGSRSGVSLDGML